MDATDELLNTGYPNSLQTELRKALKARGIDYWVAQGITFWNRDDGCECLAYGYKANGVPKLAVKVVGFTDSAQAIAATVGRRDTMGLWYEWEQVLFANVSDEVAQDNLNECVHELLDKAATMGERNPDGLPIGLTVSSDGNLLNWVGENYVRQDAATVGRGNLTAEQVREAIMSADRWRKPMGDTGMTNTHLIIRDDGWQAIADKLNATVGAGTCHIEVHDNLAETEGMGDVWLECDECHWQMPLEPTTPRFKYCPNCGRRCITAGGGW